MMLIYLFGWDLNSDDQQKVSLNLQNLSLAWCSFQWQFLLIAQTRRMIKSKNMVMMDQGWNGQSK